eukprot:1961442-Prymnesium_polylepis.1
MNAENEYLALRQHSRSLRWLDLEQAAVSSARHARKADCNSALRLTASTLALRRCPSKSRTPAGGSSRQAAATWAIPLPSCSASPLFALACALAWAGTRVAGVE